SKGVMLSHRSLLTNFLCSTATMPSREDAIFLHSPPMFHLADAAMVIGMTMVAATHAIVPMFNPQAIARASEAERVTDVVLVQTMFVMMRESVAQHRVDFASVLKVAYGASPISESLLKAAMEIFPNAGFRQAYGQTELSPVATVLLPEFHKPG